MANLIVDIGNTAIKYAVFQGNECVWHISASKNDITALHKALEHDIQQAIISSVSTTGDEVLKGLSNLPCPTLQLSTKTKLPFTLADYIPNSLGADRIAAVAGALEMDAGSNLLVIDMGTCITYEVVSADSIYLGGNISPGLRMRFKAMHEHTTLLPEIEFKGEWPGLWGVDTYTALTAGVLWGIKGEIEGYIADLSKVNPDLKVIITGGDSRFFIDKLDKGISIDGMLVEKGLNYILEYNNTK